MSLDLTLYGILDPEHCHARPLDDLAEAAIAGGATLLQLRDKTGSTRLMLQRAERILTVVNGRVPMLINDRVDVALAAGADGVHLGQDDLPVPIARRLLGEDALIGLSVKTHHEAENIPADDLDYVCIGGVFETRSKYNPTAIGLAGWSDLANICRARQTRPCPVGAIAGITPQRAAELRRAGADGVAVISALFEQEDVEAASKMFIRAWHDPDSFVKEIA